MQKMPMLQLFLNAKLIAAKARFRNTGNTEKGKYLQQPILPTVSQKVTSRAK